jgi:hypothetical protein
MSALVIKRSYGALPFPCEREILRYAGCREADEETRALLRSCLEEVKDQFIFQVCYCRLPLHTEGDDCDLGAFRVSSKALAAHLKGCEEVLVLAATVGVGIDRLIAKYAALSPSRALMLQAIGTERIEALCDRFCKDWETANEETLRVRFSPGYGDVSLSVQKDLFAVLDCGRKMGLSLRESLLMTPSKSVTAFVGVEKAREPKHGDCASKKNMG